MNRPFQVLFALLGLLAPLVGPARNADATINTHVVLIGDSIMGQLAQTEEGLLRLDGYTPATQYVPGTGLTDLTPARICCTDWNWVDHLALLDAEHDPAVVVVVLGTNDVTSVALGEDYAPHVAELLASTDAPRVLWTTCNTHSPDPARNAACTEINHDLYAVTRPGFEVVPLDEVVYSVPADINVDEVHLSPVGVTAAAQLVHTQIGPK